MSAHLEYFNDRASLDELVVHLHQVDRDFEPTLSSRTGIVEYADRLQRYARRCEAWGNGLLVGLVAGYCNDMASKTAFITSVSVARPYLRRGIGERLVRQFLGLAHEARMVRVCLEVSKSQYPARELYLKLGFHPLENKGESELMAIDLNGTWK